LIEGVVSLLGGLFEAISWFAFPVPPLDHESERVVPERVDFDRLARAWRDDPIADPSIHPGELYPRSAARQKPILGVNGDSKPGVASNDPASRAMGRLILALDNELIRGDHEVTNLERGFAQWIAGPYQPLALPAPHQSQLGIFGKARPFLGTGHKSRRLTGLK